MSKNETEERSYCIRYYEVVYYYHRRTNRVQQETFCSNMNEEEPIEYPNSGNIDDPSAFVYIKDENDGWIPALKEHEKEKRQPIIEKDEDKVDVICNQGEVRTINLKDYKPSCQLPLRDVSGGLHQTIVDDLRNLTYIHEPSVLYNTKERYENHDLIYSRVNDRVWMTVNPLRWIDGLYSPEKKMLYTKQFSTDPKEKDSGKGLSMAPHLYEVSSLAMKQIQSEIPDGEDSDFLDQTIVVSGEGGSGKTVASQILMTHLATYSQHSRAYKLFEKVANEENKETIEDESKVNSAKGTSSMFQKALDQIHYYLGLTSDRSQNTQDDSFRLDTPIQMSKGDDVEPEDVKENNLIVQRVLDINPLLEAFGNAKTAHNENSSRFSRHCKLHFHFKSKNSCNLAGSSQSTFLLEKSRVVNIKDDTLERNFHIFYQLMAAPDADKEKIRTGLSNKSIGSFKNMGCSYEGDSHTSGDAWKRTMSALHAINVHGSELQDVLLSLLIVMHLGNLTFETDPINPEGSVISSMNELHEVADILGATIADIEHCLTYKTVKTALDQYLVPLTKTAAKATCDALAKEIYSALFDWLLQRVNEATSPEKNYIYASDDTKYRTISILDLFGFENNVNNGFETLLMNHANERLQNYFTKKFVDSTLNDFIDQELELDSAISGYHNYNDDVLNLLEGKMGLNALLDEECIRPKGCDAGFVNKIYAAHGSQGKKTPPLIKKKRYNFSKTLFGISHFAGIVDYDAETFVEKNRDNLSEDVLSVAGKSSNKVVNAVYESREEFVSKKRQGHLMGKSLWTKFTRQINRLFADIESSGTFYVRCFLPNKTQSPGKIDNIHLINQMNQSGLLSALQISKTFASQHKYEDILQRFWPIISRNSSAEIYIKNIVALSNSSEDVKSDVQQLIMSMLGIKSGVERFCAIGKSKIYLKAGTLEQLERDLEKFHMLCAIKIQRVYRKHLFSRKARYSLLLPISLRPIFHSINGVWLPSLLNLPATLCNSVLEMLRGSVPRLTNGN